MMFMSGGSELNDMINITYFKSFDTLSLSRLVMQRCKTDFPYFVSMGLVLGLSQKRVCVEARTSSALVD